jgi:hypothetical protein
LNGRWNSNPASDFGLVGETRRRKPSQPYKNLVVTLFERDTLAIQFSRAVRRKASDPCLHFDNCIVDRRNLRR